MYNNHACISRQVHVLILNECFHFAEDAEGLNPNDPHFIPLVSRVQPYLVSKDIPPNTENYQSASQPFQNAPSNQQQSHGPSRQTRETSAEDHRAQGRSPLDILTSEILGSARHDDEGHGPPLGPMGPPAPQQHPQQREQRSRKARQVAIVGDTNSAMGFPPSQLVAPTQQIKSFPSAFKLTGNFKDFEKSLNNDQTNNFFQMSNQNNQNSQNSFSYPSNNKQQSSNFPNFAKNNFGGLNSLMRDGSKDQFQFGSFFSGQPQNGNGFNFQQQQPQKQSAANQQNNPAQQNNYQNNNYNNLFNQPQRNSLFNQGNQRGNGIFPQPTFEENFNRGFKKFNSQFDQLFGNQRGNQGNYGDGGGYQGQQEGQYRANDPAPQKRNAPSQGRYQQQQPRQQYGNNNFQGGNNFGAPPFPNYNAGGNFISQPGAQFGNGPGRGFQGRNPRRGYNRPPPPMPRPMPKALLQTQANLAPNSAGIDGVADLYDWLGSDEPLLQRF